MKRLGLAVAVFAVLIIPSVASAKPVASYAACFPRGELAIVRSNNPREQRVMMCSFARQMSDLVAANPNPPLVIKVNGEFFFVVPETFNGYRTFYFQEAGHHWDQIAMTLTTSQRL